MTIFDDYDRYDAVGLAHLVREGATTAGELLESAIARLEAVDPVINAACMTMYDNHPVTEDALPAARRWQSVDCWARNAIEDELW